MKTRRPLARRLKASSLQPLLTWTARRNRQARELVAAMRLACSACGSPLASHIGAGNRWNGCPTVSVKGGAR